ncbi:hypothetical protein [Corynebacterium sp. CCM 9204]|uniref:hypothetical protein n=1 Tax=Corynebacterium sp. CCM 9204 TaxID=3057616 RepID=UPI003523E9BD
MTRNQTIRIAAAVIASTLLTTSCGTSDDKNGEAPTGTPSAMMSVPPLTETTNPESPSSVHEENTRSSVTGAGVSGEVDEGESAPSVTNNPLVPDAESKRWGGDDYDRDLAAKMPEDPLYPGDQVQILGQNGVICAAGGFYGVHYIAAPVSEGCGVAEESMSAAFRGEDATRNVHFTQPRLVKLGDGRDARCVEKGNILFECRDFQGVPVSWFW